MKVVHYYDIQINRLRTLCKRGWLEYMNGKYLSQEVPAVTCKQCLKRLGIKERNDMFDTHKLNETGLEQVKTFKTELSTSITKALEMLPEGREKAVFKTKIEEAVFFGTKAIASKEGNFTEIVKY